MPTLFFSSFFEHSRPYHTHFLSGYFSRELSKLFTYYLTIPFTHLSLFLPSPSFTSFGLYSPPSPPPPCIFDLPHDIFLREHSEPFSLSFFFPPPLFAVIHLFTTSRLFVFFFFLWIPFSISWFPPFLCRHLFFFFFSFIYCFPLIFLFTI